MEDLKSLLLHEIRNGLLLTLSAEIVMRQMESNDVEKIEKAYKNFVTNLENEIDKAIKTYTKKN